MTGSPHNGATVYVCVYEHPPQHGGTEIVGAVADESDAAEWAADADERWYSAVTVGLVDWPP